MTGSLADIRCVVTGAARGIGKAAVQLLLRRGAHVGAIDCDAEELEQQHAEPGNSRLAVHHGDVSNSDAAAIAGEAPLAKLSPGKVDQVMAADFAGAPNCVRHAMPLRRGSRGTSSIKLASTQRFRGQPKALANAASIGALPSMTRSLAVDRGPEGIHADAVAPGFIDTRMAILAGGTHEDEIERFRDVCIRHGRLPLRRAGKPEHMAGPIAFLASDDSRYITGQVIVVDGCLTCTY